MADHGPTVVVLTALNLEYQAVRAHLTAIHRVDHPAGTVFEVGVPPTGHTQVALAVTGEGNTSAAVITERAIAMFQPQAIVFVGVAGALANDLTLGDIVVATKVYRFQGGYEGEDGFSPRPRAWEISHHLDQVARHVAIVGTWPALLPLGRLASPPAVHFRPVAAGDVVLNARTTSLARQLRLTYSDAAAIEMESAGVFHASHLNHASPVLTVRGISDRADGAKHLADADGWQHIAAANAAAFALGVVAEIVSPGLPSAERVAAAPPRTRVDQPGIDWQALDTPVEVAWRDRLAITTGHERAAVELHLATAAVAGRLEVRRLAPLANELAHLGRAHGLFTAQERLDIRSTHEYAYAAATEYSHGPAGLAVTRTGQRSAWRPLPNDMLGAVVDPTDLRQQVADMIRLLVSIELPTPQLVTPAIGLTASSTIAEGDASTMPRTQAPARLLRTPLRVSPDETLYSRDLTNRTTEVADELTQRLLALFRQTP